LIRKTRYAEPYPFIPSSVIYASFETGGTAKEAAIAIDTILSKHRPTCPYDSAMASSGQISGLFILAIHPRNPGKPEPQHRLLLSKAQRYPFLRLGYKFV